MNRCRYCNQRIAWTVMESGAKNPLNPEPDDERGNIAVDADTGKGIQLGRDQADSMRDTGAALYLSHWATCPERNKAARDRDRRRAKRP